MDLTTMIADCSDLKTLKVWEKSFPSEVKGAIAARIAVLTKKPEYTYKLKLNPKGGLALPVSVYLDGDGGTKAIDSLIAALESYKAHPDAKSYSKG
jgi:hypothetical protein